MDEIRKTLLTNRDLRDEYNLGRDLAGSIAERLPHVVVGRSGRGVKRLVHRDDLNRLLDRAKAESADLWLLVKTHDARSLRRWLDHDRTESA